MSTAGSGVFIFLGCTFYGQKFLSMASFWNCQSPHPNHLSSPAHWHGMSCLWLYPSLVGNSVLTSCIDCIFCSCSNLGWGAHPCWCDVSVDFRGNWWAWPCPLTGKQCGYHSNPDKNQPTRAHVEYNHERAEESFMIDCSGAVPRFTRKHFKWKFRIKQYVVGTIISNLTRWCLLDEHSLQGRKCNN